jgi:hypothetical protein
MAIVVPSIMAVFRSIDITGLVGYFEAILYSTCVILIELDRAMIQSK